MAKLDAREGGPVLRIEYSKEHGDVFAEATSITLRELYAGLAMAGLLACGRLSHDQGQLAERAWKQADAMIQARDK